MKDDWATPQPLFNKLDAEFHFTLDVCALPENAKCRRYYSPTQDGLAQSWEGETCWMNPPFGKAIEGWLRKASELDHGFARRSVVVALVPTRTNAPWWHDYVMRAAEIRFIRKKVSFVGDKQGVAFTGHAIVVFRPGQHEPRCTSWEQPARVKSVREAA